MNEFEKKLNELIFGDLPGLVPSDSYNTLACSEKSFNLKNLARVHLSTDYIDGIFVDEVKKVVVTKFADGDREVVKCSDHDDFDIVIGVALGLARHLFGHTKFYKGVVGNKIKYSKRIEPEVTYSDYCEWCRKHNKKFVAESTFKRYRQKYLDKMKGIK